MTPGVGALRLAWRQGGLRGLALAAALAWLVSIFWQGAGGPCGAGHHHATRADLAVQCAPAALADWMLMAAAMMTPLLVPVVNHIWHSSMARRRIDCLLALAVGYGLCWMVAGLLLQPAVVALEHGWARFAAMLALSVAWSCSPVAQYARNRCHRLRGIDPFGLAADRDSFFQGLIAGAPCVLACWPWMLVPMAAPAGHELLAAAITVLLFMERLARPQRPSWRSPPALDTLRLLLARPKVLAGPAGRLGGV